MSGVLCAPGVLSGERSPIEHCGRIAPRPSRQIPATALPSALCPLPSAHQPLRRRLLTSVLSALWQRMLHSTICSGCAAERNAPIEGCREMQSPEIGKFVAITSAASSPCFRSWSICGRGGGRGDEDCENFGGFRRRCVRPLVAVVCRRGVQCVEDRLSRAG